MQRFLVAAFALASLTACMNERTYMDPYSGGGYGLGANALAALRGNVGELADIDTESPEMWMTREPRVVQFSGNVPHQARPSSSVFLDIRIANAEQLPVGQELRQEGLRDTWGEEIEGPALDVYVCPNGEGVSGNADDIVVTRTGPDRFTFRAISTNVDQNLDVDLDLIPN
jgi:hypothetical protein